MRLTIDRLGRIEHAELEIKPLTVFIGPNNTNKSWCAYAAYTCERALSYRQFADGRYRGTDYALPAGARQAIDAALSHAASHTSDFELVVARGEVQPLALSTTLNDEMLTRLTGGFLRETGALARAVYEPEDLDLPLFASVRLHLARRGERVRVDAVFSGARGAGSHVAEVPTESLEDYLEEQLFALAFSGHWNTIALPVGRSLPRQDGAVPPVSADLARWVSEARALVAGGQAGGDSRVRALLERVIGGRLTVDVDERMEFRPSEGVRVPLHAAASMVNAQAALWLYLRALAEPGDRLVIDEPEMNLHPRAQLALMELLAVMVNRGYHVLFTTHSPYLVEHLNTLIKGATRDAGYRRTKAPSFALGQPDAFLDLDKVAAYEFVDDGDRVTVKDAVDHEWNLVDVSTFAEQTNKMGDLYDAMLVGESE